MPFQSPSIFSPAYYVSDPGLHWLLVEHYGMPDQIVPVQRAALRHCDAKIETVNEAMRRVNLPRRHRAIDLGCAVGGATFRLRHYFDEVVGYDYSPAQLAQARELQKTHSTSVTWKLNGFEDQTCVVHLPVGTVTEGIEFREGDIYAPPADLGVFDFVYMDKVLECLPDPVACMKVMPGLVAPGGYFVNVSSYRWSHEFTPLEKQLGTPAKAPGQIAELLRPHFQPKGRFKAPFLLECNTNWFCYGVAEALLFKRL